MSAKNIDDQEFEGQAVEGQDDAAYEESYDDTDVYTEDDSEEWADSDDLGDGTEDGAEQQEPQQKKKSSVLTIVIILVVAVVGVFGFLLFKGSGAPSPEQVAETPAVIDADPDVSPNPSAANDVLPVPAGDATTTAQPVEGILDNPAALEQVGQTASMPDAPILTADAPPVPMLGEETAAQPNIPSKEDVVAAIAPTVKPVSDFPTVDSIKKPNVAPAASAPAVPVPAIEEPEITATLPVPTANEAIPAPLAAPMTAPADMAAVDTKAADAKLAEVQAQLAAAQSRIGGLEKDLVAKTTQLEAEKAKVAKPAPVAPAPASSVSEAEVSGLKAKIADLESKLAQKVAKPVVQERTIVESDEDNYVSQPAVAKKPVVAAPVKEKPIVRQNWTLKSAGSGKAILADKATGDLKTVRVGDTVSGLGRITSISDSSSAWVVKGTAGSVSE